MGILDYKPEQAELLRTISLFLTKEERMQHIGTRKSPSILSLILIVVIFLIIIGYLVISFGTGDFLWWNPKFSENPSAVVLHCYGQTININPGSYHFGALTDIVNESLSGRKRWDSLSLSEETYQEYQSNPNSMTIELFYNEPIRVHSNYKFFSSVDNIIIPLDGRHASYNTIFGQNQGVPVGGSLHIESIQPIGDYLKNQDLCPYKLSSQ